ncbi:OsmC family protein [Sandaracinobacter sp. RS1-74]|uniref:Putative redox protein n=2 Tax=Sphingobium TaxID=165695 RepID=A0A7W6LXK3_9SPHN|nr:MULTISPECIES: OsmC family protein [Sphingomonadales]MBB4151357.1 putative redox protein [Sphingobium scionense]MCG2839550.1 OsmC family protein [Sandaracinobacteroides sayramensis]
MVALRTRATASETGESLFAVQIEMGAHSIVGDEPISAGGEGLGPNPFELMTAALAECSAITVRWFARQQNWPLEHVEVVVDHAKKLSAGSSTPADVFEKTVFIRGVELDGAQRKRLLDVAAKCPIQRILEGAPVINTKLGRSLDESLGK